MHIRKILASLEQGKLAKLSLPRRTRLLSEQRLHCLLVWAPSAHKVYGTPSHQVLWLCADPWPMLTNCRQMCINVTLRSSLDQSTTLLRWVIVHSPYCANVRRRISVGVTRSAQNVHYGDLLHDGAIVDLFAPTYSTNGMLHAAWLPVHLATAGIVRQNLLLFLRCNFKIDFTFWFTLIFYINASPNSNTGVRAEFKG